ncbi:MAG: pyridoxal-dependent decarboxylase, partial [Pyrinomonadaceae bacterium]
LVPEYLRTSDQETVKNGMDYGIQLGRRFRALKAWMVFSAFGQTGLIARIREHIRLAKLFAGWIDGDPAFELLAPVTMGVVCFRAIPSETENVGDQVDPQSSLDHCNELNRSIVQAVNATGAAYITHTKLGNKIAMRIAVGNVLTTEEHLADVYRLIGREFLIAQKKSRETIPVAIERNRKAAM